MFSAACEDRAMLSDASLSTDYAQLCLSGRPKQLHEPLAFSSECLGSLLLNIGERSIRELGAESIGNLVSTPRVDIKLDVSVFYFTEGIHTLVTPALTMAWNNLSGTSSVYH
jgi:hypothetical protein